MTGSPVSLGKTTPLFSQNSITYDSQSGTLRLPDGRAYRVVQLNLEGKDIIGGKANSTTLQTLTAHQRSALLSLIDTVVSDKATQSELQKTAHDQVAISFQKSNNNVLANVVGKVSSATAFITSVVGQKLQSSHANLYSAFNLKSNKVQFRKPTSAPPPPPQKTDAPSQSGSASAQAKVNAQANTLLHPSQPSKKQAESKQKSDSLALAAAETGKETDSRRPATAPPSKPPLATTPPPPPPAKKPPAVSESDAEKQAAAEKRRAAAKAEIDQKNQKSAAAAKETVSQQQEKTKSAHSSSGVHISTESDCDDSASGADDDDDETDSPQSPSSASTPTSDSGTPRALWSQYKPRNESRSKYDQDRPKPPSKHAAAATAPTTSSASARPHPFVWTPSEYDQKYSKARHASVLSGMARPASTASATTPSTAPRLHLAVPPNTNTPILTARVVTASSSAKVPPRVVSEDHTDRKHSHSLLNSNGTSS